MPITKLSRSSSLRPVAAKAQSMAIPTANTCHPLRQTFRSLFSRKRNHTLPARNARLSLTISSYCSVAAFAGALKSRITLYESSHKLLPKITRRLYYFVIRHAQIICHKPLFQSFLDYTPRLHFMIKGRLNFYRHFCRDLTGTKRVVCSFCSSSLC